MTQFRRVVPGLLAVAMATSLALALVATASPAPGDPAVRARTARFELTGGTSDIAQWRPTIIFNDGKELTSLSVPITDGSFEAVYVTTEGVLVSDAGRDNQIRLYDDGTNGDVTAGDGTWSRSGITATGKVTHDGGTHPTMKNGLVFVTGTEATEPTPLDEGIGIVDVSQRGTVQVSRLSDTLFATSHALFLVDDGSNFPNYPQVDEDLLTQRCEACRILIETFGDIFDFVNIQVREHIPSSAASQALAWNASMISDAGGIGVAPYNNNSPEATFSTKIRSIMFENQINGESLTHEVIHAWGTAIGESLGLSTTGGHYSPSTTVSGVIDDPLMDADGFLLVRPDSSTETDLVANGDGTFRVVARPGAFNPTIHPLTLYQAGFIPPSQVPAV